MYDYKSPIELFETKSEIKSYQDELDNLVMERIFELDVRVDKEELVKALEYDRHQYDKGYKDGLNYLNKQVEKFKWHDLRIDPSDLPKESSYVLVQVEYQHFESFGFYVTYDYMVAITNEYFYNTLLKNTIPLIVRWMYIDCESEENRIKRCNELREKLEEKVRV